MQAIVQNGFGSPDALELQEVDRPAVADDGVLLRVRAASINAMDWHFLGFMGRLVGRSSRIRGVDVAGTVEACGPNATRFRLGDEVFGVARGAFAEYAATAESRLVPKPASLTFEQAAAIPVAGCTALALRDKAHVEPGQRVLVYGAGGGVGTFAVQIASALGARVTAVTRTEHVEMVRSIGADQVIDYTREDFTRRGERYDVVFDVGANRSTADCRRVLAPNGKLLLVGAPKNLLSLVPRLLETMMPGSRSAAVMARASQQELVALKELVEAGKLSPVIDRTYPLAVVREAFRYFGTGRVRGKIVIRLA